MLLQYAQVCATLKQNSYPDSILHAKEVWRSCNLTLCWGEFRCRDEEIQSPRIHPNHPWWRRGRGTRWARLAVVVALLQPPILQLAQRQAMKSQTVSSYLYLNELFLTLWRNVQKSLLYNSISIGISPIRQMIKQSNKDQSRPYEITS